MYLVVDCQLGMLSSVIVFQNANNLFYYIISFYYIGNGIIMLLADVTLTVLITLTDTALYKENWVWIFFSLVFSSL